MELIDKFLIFEKNHNMIEKKIDDFYYWVYMRFELYSDFQRQKKEMKNSAYAINDSRIKKLLSQPQKLIWAWTRSMMRCHKKCNVLFVNHERRMSVEGIDVPIYFDELIKNYSGEYVIVEPRNINNWHYQNEKYMENTYYLDDILNYKTPLHIKTHKYVNQPFEVEFKEILTAMEAEFDVVIDKNKWIQWVYYSKKRYESNKKQFIRMLRQISPQKIVEVVYYNNVFMALNEAAHELDIPVYELQHGIMGYYHIAYNFDKQYSLPLLPDNILLFSEYWMKNTRFPLPKKSQFAVGYPYMESMVEKYRRDNDDKLTILFISQRTIGKQLSSFAVELEKLLNKRAMEHKIYYKLHPAECSDWNEELPELYKNRGKIDVISDPSRGIYELFGVSNYQIGVYSTAIFEGMAFGLKTFVLNVDGSENVRDLCDGGYAELINSAEEFINKMTKVQNETEFWKKGAVDNILKLLK